MWLDTTTVALVGKSLNKVHNATKVKQNKFKLCCRPSGLYRHSVCMEKEILRAMKNTNGQFCSNLDLVHQEWIASGIEMRKTMKNRKAKGFKTWCSQAGPDAYSRLNDDGWADLGKCWHCSYIFPSCYILLLIGSLSRHVPPSLSRYI